MDAGATVGKNVTGLVVGLGAGAITGGAKIVEEGIEFATGKDAEVTKNVRQRYQGLTKSFLGDVFVSRYLSPIYDYFAGTKTDVGERKLSNLYTGTRGFAREQFQKGGQFVQGFNPITQKLAATGFEGIDFAAGFIGLGSLLVSTARTTRR